MLRSTRRGSTNKVAAPSWSTERGGAVWTLLTRARGGRTQKGPWQGLGSREGKELREPGAELPEARAPLLRAPQQCLPRPPPRASLTRACRARPGGGAAEGPPPCRPRPAQGRRRAPQSPLGARCNQFPAPCALRAAPGHSQGPLRAPSPRRGCGLVASPFLLVLVYELK